MGITAARKLENRKLVSTELALFRGRCWFCDQAVDHPAWHHVDPADKIAAISRLVSRGTGAALKRELEKCVPVHEECHNEHHRFEATTLVPLAAWIGSGACRTTTDVGRTGGSAGSA